MTSPRSTSLAAVAVALGFTLGIAISPSGAASSMLDADCRSVKLVSVRGSGDTLNAIGKLGVRVSGALARRARELGVDYGVHGLEYTAVGIDWWKLTPTGLAVLYVQYQRSKNEGRDKLRAFVKEQVRYCPKQKLALLGFSQGAHVVGDVLSKKVGRLTSSERAAVRAVALVADPRFNSREPFATGKDLQSGRNGILGARSPGDLESVMARIRSWCRAKDLVCQGLPNPLRGIHNEQGYYEAYGEAIVDFLAERLGLRGKTIQVWIEPRLRKQRARLGELLISRDGTAIFQPVAKLEAQLPGSRCIPADRVVHPPLQRDVLPHAMLRPSARGMTVYLGALGPVECSALPPDSLLAAEWLRISADQVRIVTPLGTVRIGSPVPLALAQLAVPTGRFLLWPLADPCTPARAALLDYQQHYLLRTTLQGEEVAAIDVRTGVLEVGECSP